MHPIENARSNSVESVCWRHDRSDGQKLEFHRAVRHFGQARDPFILKVLKREIAGILTGLEAIHLRVSSIASGEGERSNSTDRR